MDSRALQESQPLLIQSNCIVKCCETVVTLPDKTCKRKFNELVLQPRLSIRCVQKYQCDNLHIKFDSDDFITVGSPLGSPLLGNDVDVSSFVPQQGSHVCIPTENLSDNTVASSSQICVAGNVSIAPSSQQLHSSGQVSTSPSSSQLMDSTVMRRKKNFQEQCRLPVMWEPRYSLILQHQVWSRH